MSINDDKIIKNSANARIVDSHCHLDCLDLKAFKGVSKECENPSLSDVINHAKSNDVDHMLCVCIDLEHFNDVLSIAKKYPFISASVGKHPTDKEGFEPSVQDLVKHVNDNPEVIAVGETGLDYFHGSKSDIQNQKDRFDTHIQASIETKKPLIIHSRDAKEDTLAFLSKSSSQGSNGVFHCFTGDYEMAKAGIDLGFYISFYRDYNI